jgi:hypothetical protein
MAAKVEFGKPAILLSAALAAFFAADAACAQASGGGGQSPYARYGAQTGSGDPVTAVDSMTAPGDETSSLPNPAADGAAPSGAGTDWSASPAGDNRVLAVVTAPSANQPAKQQPSDVSAGSGPNGNDSDAH